MALEEKIEAVSKVSQALKKQPEMPVEIERVAPNKEQFDTLLNAEKDKFSQSIKTNDSSLVIDKPTSLLDEVKKLNTKVNNISHLTPEDLQKQAKEVIAQIDDVKTQLSKAEDIKPSYQTLLKNRLTHVDDNLKIALSKAGVEYDSIAQAAPTKNNLVNPMQRFLGFLTHGQYQLEHLEKTIEHLNLTGAQLSPVNMLAIQIKVGQVQQEIELFTSLLNKSLESTKTIMNVQV